MIRVIMVRHGRDNDNKELTRLGRKQAKMVVKELEYEKIDRIYASPTERTRQTAQIIAKKLKKDVIFDERLREREKSSGLIDGEEKREYDKNYLNPNFSRQNPEGCKEYYERISQFLDEVLKNSGENDTVLIVGHSSMCYVMNAYFCKKPKDQFLDWMRIGNCSKICFEYLKKE